MSKTTVEKWQDLVRKLIQLTHSKDLSWSDTNNTYVAKINDRKIHITKLFEFDGEINIRFSIYKEGPYGLDQLIDKFDDDDLTNIEYSEIDAFLGTIQRSITGADVELDSLLGDLDNLGKQPN